MSFFPSNDAAIGQAIQDGSHYANQALLAIQVAFEKIGTNKVAQATFWEIIDHDFPKIKERLNTATKAEGHE